MVDIRKREGKKGVSYQVRYPSPSTASGYAFKTFKTRKEAVHFSAQSQLNPQDSHHGQALSVTDAVDQWLTICEQVGRDGRERVEPQTLIEYKRRAAVIIEYPWVKTIEQLTPQDIIQFRTWLLAHKSRDLARRTLSSFHSVLLEMKMQGYLHHDPAANITVKVGDRYDDHEIDIPSDQEMAQIYQAIDRLAMSPHRQKRDAWQRFKPMFYLAGFSGMRPSEYRGLPWKNVQSRRILVTQRADKTGIIGPVKSKAAKREIIIPALVDDLLVEWRAMTSKKDDELVFGTMHNRPLLLTNIFQGAWYPLMQEAGLLIEVHTDTGTKRWPKYSMYCLRHYFASKLIEANYDFKYIQKVMGHSKIEITFNNYGHLISGNEDAYKLKSDRLAETILNTCGKSVAHHH